MANALTYIKNVGKSIGYASVEVFKEKNPVFADFAETNGELMTNAYKSVKDLKKTIKDLPNKIMESEVGQFGQTYLDNLMSDLKTGKFYNKERSEQYMTDAAGAGTDMSVFDDFGDGDGDEGFDLSALEDDGEGEISTNEMLDIVGEKSSTAVSTAVARSAEYVVQANAQTSKAMYNQMNAIYGGIHTGMSAINQNISKVIEYANENLNLHIENSKTFYSEMTNAANEQTQYLKEISETLKLIQNPPKEGNNSSSTSYSDLVSYEGSLDIAKYFNYVKKSITENSELGMITNLMKMAESAGGLKAFAASPLEGLVKGMINSVIPEVLDKSMERLNQSISGLAANALIGLRGKGKEKGGIWETISNIFGIDTSVKESIDVSQYEKGKVPFDGITRKAIIEVIPTYLSKILSTLNGQARDTFDYEKGQFVTIESLKKRVTDMKTSRAKSAASDLTSIVNDKASEFTFRNDAQKKQFYADWDAMVQWMYTNQQAFNPRDTRAKASDFGLTGGKASDANLELFRAILDNTPETLSYNHKMLREANAHTKRMEELEASGTLNAAYNDATGNGNVVEGGIASVLKNANTDVVDKLNDIHKELSYIRVYGTGGGYSTASTSSHTQGINLDPNTITIGGFSTPGGIIVPNSGKPNFDSFSASSGSAGTTSDGNDKADDTKSSDTSLSGGLASIFSSVKNKKDNSTSEEDDSWRDSIKNAKKEAKAIMKHKYETPEEKEKRKEAEAKVKQAEKEERKREREEAEKKKTIFDRISGVKKTSLGIIQGPMELAAKIMDKADARIYELVFGPEGGREVNEFDNRSLSEVLFDNLQNQFDKFSDWMHEKVFEPLTNNSLKENAYDAAKRFLSIFKIDLDKTVDGMKEFILGVDKNGAPTKGGFIGKFFSDFKEGFKSFGNWIKGGFKDLGETAGVTSKKNKQGEQKEKQNTQMRQAEEAIQTGKNSLSAVLDIFGNNSVETEKIQEHATGTRRVTKTGLAVISEGEMIVPPDLNPFNIAKRHRDEKQVKENIKRDAANAPKGIFGKAKDFISNQLFNKGVDNIYEYGGGTTDATSGEEDIPKKVDPKRAKAEESMIQNKFNKLLQEDPTKAVEYLRQLKEKSPVSFAKFQGFLDSNEEMRGKFAAHFKSGVQKLQKEDYEEGKNPFGQKMLDVALSGTEAVVNHTIGVLGLNEDDHKNFKENATNFLGEIKEHGGTLAAGATIGAGVSLLTGLVGGPLVGAAAGAGVALITKSKAVQNMLFGDEETGESGLLPKDMTEAIKKYLPSMGLGGALGGIISMIPGIPGGPLAGILVGSALGFAKNSQAAQEFLFGFDGLGMDKDKIVGKVKSALPKMGVGALAGLIAGPFSIPANILLGSALGFAADSESFKDVIFGEEVDGKRSGGLFGAVVTPAVDFFKESFIEFKRYLKEDIFAPVKNAMAPLAEDFRLMSKAVGDAITNFFKENIGRPVEMFIKENIIDPIGKSIKGLLTWISKPLKALVAAPFKAIGGIGDARRRSHIKSGNAKYMGAAQRNAFRKSKGAVYMGKGDDFAQFDEALEKVSNDDLDVMKAAFSAVKDAKRSHTLTEEESFKRIKKEMYSHVSGKKTHISKAALDMVKKGQYTEAIEFVKKADIEEKAKTSIIAKLTSESARMKMSREMRDNANQGAARIAELAKGLGFEIDQEKLMNDPKYAEKILQNLDSEDKYRKKYQKNPIEDLNDDQKKRHDEIVKIIADIRDALLGDKNVDAEDFSKKSTMEKFNEQFKDVAEGEKTAEEVNEENGEQIKKRNLRGTISQFRSKVRKKADKIKQGKDEMKGNVSNYIKNVRRDITENEKFIHYFGDKNKRYYGDADKEEEKSFNTKLGETLRQQYRDVKSGKVEELSKEPSEPGKLSPYEQQALKERIAQRSGGKILSKLSEKANSGDEKAAEAADKTAKIIAAMAAKQGIDLKRIHYDRDLGSEITRITSKTKKKSTKIVDGLPMVYTTDKDGNEIVDASNAENKETTKKLEEKDKVQKGILSGLTGIPTALGGIFTKLFGDKDKEKESIFDKIFNFFTGKGGGISLLSVLTSAIPLVVAGFGLSGKFDDIISAITNKKFGDDDTNQTQTITDENGNVKEIVLDENGNPIKDMNGDYMTKSGEVVSGDSYRHMNGSLANMSASDRLKYNLVRGTITGKGSIVGGVFKANKLVKGIRNKTAPASSLLKRGINKAIASSKDPRELASVVNTINTSIRKWISNISQSPLLPKSVDASKLEGLRKAIENLVIKYLPKAGKAFDAIKSTLGKLALPILAITVIADFSTGWQDASTILKIQPENVTLPQKIICGLVRTFKNFIPIIGTFIPDQAITDLFINHVAGWFGINTSEIKKQQEEAAADLAEYNAKNGTNYSWNEYNKIVNKQYTWTEKIGNGVKSVVSNVKEKGLAGAAASAWKDSRVSRFTAKAFNKAAEFGGKVKDKALEFGGKVKDIAGNVKDKAIDIAGNIRDKVTDFFSPAVNAINEKLIGPLKNIGSYGINVVKDTWDEMISGEAKDSENLVIAENDPYGSIKKIIYNMVKILAIVPSNMIKLGKSIWEKFKQIGSGMVTLGQGLATSVQNQFTNAWKGDIIAAFTDVSGVQTDNPLIENISKVVNFVPKILLAGPTLLTASLGNLVRKTMAVIDGIKTIGGGLATSVQNQFTNAWNGDIKSAFTDLSGVQTDNPFLNGLSKVVNVVPKILLAGPTLLASGIGFVARNINNIVDGFKTIGSSAGSMISDVMSKALSGSLPIEEIFTNENSAQTGNGLVDGISTVINTVIKVPLTPIALMTTAISFAKNKLTDFFNGVVEAGKISDADKELMEKAKKGDVSPFSKDYWTVNSPLTGVAKGFNTLVSMMNKVFTLPMALLSYINPLQLLEKGTDWIAKKFGIDDSETKEKKEGSGSGLYGRGSNDHQVEAPNFISQVDPKYRNVQFNIKGDSQRQTLGDSGCAPAAAAMAVNGTTGGASMESASKLALNYKAKDDGVRASYFDEEFSRHGLRAEYSSSSSDIKNQLMNNNKVVLMGQDRGNTSKANSPFGPNPHYVTATGMSRDGKYVYINDPESTSPNIKYSASKVLGSSKLGVAATARGTRSVVSKFKKYTARGTYGPETVQYKVWNALRAAGYNEIATAAAMGNIQHESGFKVDAIEKGSGAGFGLIQWTGGRRTQIENYAAQKGVSPSDLGMQLEFLLKELAEGSGQWTKADPRYGLGELSRNDWASGADISKATKAFMCCFERPTYDRTKNHIDRRLESAAEYYQAFTGSAIDTNLSFDTSYASSTGSTGGTSSSGSSNSGGTVLSKILSAFSGLASAYGLTGSDSSSSDVYPMHSGEANMNYVSEGGLTYNNTVKSAEGNVSSNPEHAAKQKQLVEQMYAIEGRLKYAQGNSKYPGSRNPEDGSGDCSSTVQWAYKKILGQDPGGNTRDQRVNGNTFTVKEGSGATRDESWLQLGDLLLKDGHVEMYAGNNTMIGHGGGSDGQKPGPTVKKLDQSGKYNLVRRWVGFKDTGSGSGLAYDNALHYITAKGSEPQSTPKLSIPYEIKQSDVYDNTMPISNIPSYNNTSTSSNNSGFNDGMIRLMSSIIKLLSQVVTNTAQLNEIVRLLGEYLNAEAAAAKGSGLAYENEVARGSGDARSAAILAKQNLINAMQNNTSHNVNSAELQRLIERAESMARE